MPSRSKVTKPAPPAHWLIMTFFVAAAVRKGARDLPKWIRARDTKSQIVRDGHDYRIETYFDNKSKHPSTFTVHSSGLWTYDAGPTYLEGKLQPPHAKGWVDKMITKGTPGEFAKADWSKYFALRNKSK